MATSEPTPPKLSSFTSMSKPEARALIRLYYLRQEDRKASGSQISAIKRGVHYDFNTLEFPMLRYMHERYEQDEEYIRKALTVYAKSCRLGRWCMSIPGLGGVTTAGLLAEVDFHRCCCETYRHLKGSKRDAIPPHDCRGLASYGNILSFAGFDPPGTHPWNRGELRPYSALLKQVCFHIASGFKKLVPSTVKLAMSEEERRAVLDEKQMRNLELRQERLGDPLMIYPRLYLKHKEIEHRRNEEGLNRELAWKKYEENKDNPKLRRKNPKVEQSALQCWKSGKLQKDGVDKRAMRRALTIFISHFFQVGREIYFGDKVTPYIFAHGQGHTHYIPPPNWPMVEEVSEAG